MAFVTPDARARMAAQIKTFAEAPGAERNYAERVGAMTYQLEQALLALDAFDALARRTLALFDEIGANLAVPDAQIGELVSLQFDLRCAAIGLFLQDRAQTPTAAQIGAQGQ